MKKYKVEYKLCMSSPWQTTVVEPLEADDMPNALKKARDRLHELCGTLFLGEIGKVEELIVV